MERKIGEIFELHNEWYQCVEGNYCSACCLYDDCFGYLKLNYIGNCGILGRSDKKSVIFKKLEKVGEPYVKSVSDGTVSTFQRYRVYNSVILPKEPYIYCNFIDSTIEIEIKQNKEDMEENHKAEDTLLLTKLISRYVNNLIDYETFEKAVKELYSDKKNSKLTLKEFDLEAAKAGKPVCTRDGRKARIICFDLKAEKPIVALITNDDKEEAHFYYNNGRSNQYQGYRYDLMMLPEKKTGWINIKKDGGIFKSREEAERNCSDDYFVVEVEWEE